MNTKTSDGSELRLSEFAALDNPARNEALDQLKNQGVVYPLTASHLGSVGAANPSLFLAAQGALWALAQFEPRLHWLQARPVIRRLLLDLAPFENSEAEVLNLEELADEFGWHNLLGDGKALESNIVDATIRQGGPLTWQEVLALHVVWRDRDPYLNMYEPQILAMQLDILASSRRLLKITKVWDEVWTRVPYQDSDLSYHDSRLRRALLDRNLDHAFRLMGAVIKAGKPAADVIGHLLRASFDIDLVDPGQSLLIPGGISGILSLNLQPKSREFQHCIARLVYDIMHCQRSAEERVHYDRLSLIKSRDILVDFRSAFLSSDFLASWGIAEYAFIHGFEAKDLNDELFRLSPSLFEDSHRHMLAMFHLGSVSQILEALPEEYHIYVMAYTIRILSSVDKRTDLLDPFELVEGGSD